MDGKTICIFVYMLCKHIFTSGALGSTAVQSGTTRYFISSTEDNFTGAERTCRDKNYTGLASASTLTELGFLRGNVQDLAKKEERDYWVGAYLANKCANNDPRRCRGDWQWIDGTRMTNDIINNGWNNDEPNHHNELCGRLTADKLAGRSCGIRYKFICGRVDACLSSPCQRNGTCLRENRLFRCICSDGYTGHTCETDINECQSNPCLNGNCRDNINGFQCNCTGSGYTGLLCDDIIQPNEEENKTAANLKIALIVGSFLDLILLPTAVLLYIKYRSYTPTEAVPSTTTL